MIINVKGRKFKIRKYSNKDYWFAYTLLKRNMLPFFKKYWGGWDPKNFRSNLNAKNIKIIEYKNKRVGYYDLKFEKTFSYLNNIQISNLLRSKGLGTYLMIFVEQQTKKHKLNRIRLQVFKDNKAINFYRKLGYKKIGNRYFSVILEKKI